MKNKIKIDTFSANSLEILKNSKEEFYKKYVQNLELIIQNDEIKEGDKFHKLICYYLKDYDIKKFESALNKEESALWENLKNSKPLIEAKCTNEKFTEQPFIIKEILENKDFYLTGRFDLIIKKEDKYIIFDWKIKNIPDNYIDNMQTIVYLYAAEKLFKTNNIEMVYYSLTKDIYKIVPFDNNCLEKIKEVIKKIY